MIEHTQFWSTVLIMIGLGLDVIGAIILIISSNKFSNFVINQMNKSTNEKVEEQKKKLMIKQKDHTSNGLSILLIGFIVQIVGYLISIELLFNFS